MPRNLLYVEAPAPSRRGDCGPPPQTPEDPAGHHSQSEILQLCERLATKDYVYLVHPSVDEMTDTDGGVRLLPYTDGSLPGFGHLDGVYAIGDPGLLPQLRENYPETPLHLWLFPGEGDMETASRVCAETGAHLIADFASPVPHDNRVGDPTLGTDREFAIAS